MKFPEKYRIESVLGLDTFKIPFTSRVIRIQMVVIATNDNGVEHVSVSLPNRCPTWNEMCHIKRLFWEDEEECIQFHPKKSEYVNLHAHCLHMWRFPDEIMRLLKPDMAVDKMFSDMIS